MLNIFKPLVPLNLELIELENVCRICLDSSTNMSSLFDNDIDSVISEFLPQKLHRIPLQPHQICAKCFEQAKTAYIFKKQCEYSDELIKSMLKEPNICKTYKKQTQNDISKNIYPCKICENRFETSEILIEHRLKEHYKSPNTSDKCDEFITKNGATNHLGSAHSELEKLSGFSSNKCNLCKQMLTDRNFLKTNFNVHDINESFLAIEEDVINEAIEEDSSTFVKIGKYEFSCGNCLENFEVEDELKNHACQTSLYEKVLDRNSSNELQLINDCNENKIGVVLVCDENTECDSIFEDNLKTDNEHKGNRGEKNYEIFAPEIEIKSEKLYAEEFGVAPKIVGAVITEPKNKITREVKINAIANPVSFAKSECLRGHRGEKPYKCRYCDKTFVTLSDHNKHERTHTGEENYHCTVCSKSFTRAKKLQVHMRNHTGERPYYKCSYCPLVFTDNDSLTKHHRKHTGERFYCDLCSLSFTLPKKLLKHKRKVHEETKEFSCKYCSEKIIGEGEYKKHCKVHHNAPAKPHICSECGMSFIQSQHLRIHIRRHTGEKPYKCQYCDRAFVATSDIYRHTKTHTTKKSHQCTICPKTFVTTTQLKFHMRSHSTERSYKCLYCPKAFKDNRTLKKHLEKHTSEGS